MSPETEEKTVCLGNLAFGETLGSRAWLADLEKRESQGSQVLQDSRA